MTFGFLATLTHSSKVVITCCHTTILTYHFFPTRKGNVFSQCIPTYVFLRICFDSFSFLLLIMKKKRLIFFSPSFLWQNDSCDMLWGPATQMISAWFEHRRKMMATQRLFQALDRDLVPSTPVGRQLARLLSRSWMEYVFE